MPEEMIEDAIWESDGGEDWESDDAIIEADDSIEDIGERARYRRRGRYFRPRNYPARSAYSPSRGVQGIAVKGQDGSRSYLQFPQKVATAAETNRGLASQELARRALDERLNRLETRFQVQQKNDTSVSGLVSLVIGGGLVTFGAIQAATNKASGSFIGKWAAENSTQLGSVVFVSHIATTGAKSVINRRYPGTVIGIATDIFAVAELATFAFGSLSRPKRMLLVADKAEAEKAMAGAEQGTLFLTKDNNAVFQLEFGVNGDRALRSVNLGID